MFKEDFDRMQEGLKVIKRGNKYCLKFRPEILYATKEEAERQAEKYSNCQIFF